MGTVAKFRRRQLGLLAAGLMAMAYMPTALALPTGEHNISKTDGVNDLTVTRSKNTYMNVELNRSKAAVDWKSFNIANGETVKFSGPGQWMVLNRVVGGELSEIAGKLSGQGGTVFLVNPAGITFAEGASVSVGSLVASTLDISQKDFMDGKYTFAQDGTKVGVITNLAKLNLSRDSKVVLLAHQIINEGTIYAGQVGLGAGKEIELALDDKIDIKVNVGVDKSQAVNILNSGTLSANSPKNGYVLMTAGEAKDALNGIVANSGTVVAKRIEKDKDGNVILAEGGDIDIRGYSIWNSGEIRADGGQIKDGKVIKGGNGGHITIEGNSIVTEKAVKAIGRLSEDEAASVIEGKKVADGGSISLTGEKLVVAGSVNADGPVNGGVINTIGTKDLLVAGSKKIQKSGSCDYFATASVHAAGENGKAGTWNIESANVNISHDVITTDKGNVVNNRVVGSSLKTTNVNVLAKPGSPTDFADIKVANEITKKTEGTDTSLTMTAGRNISVDADITSTDGKLNLTLNSNNELDGKSERIDGASIIRANIDTNGGNFTTTGKNGTYFGLKDKEKAGTERTVATKGGSITLNGEVLLATGGKVTLDTTAADGKVAGDVTVTGTVDSGNRYTVGETSYKIPWDNKSGELHGVTETGSKESAEAKGGYLAVITSGLEDAVVNSVAPADVESHIGGHVVVMPEGVTCTVDANGNIELTGLSKDGKIPEGKLQLLYTDTEYEGNKDEVRAEDGNRGWYKVDKNTWVRLWAWVTGPEAGKVFYVQAVRSADGSAPSQANYRNLKHFGKAYGYTNFLANEPNDDLIQKHSQNCLAINYHFQWDDIYEDIHDNCDLVKNYVVETELGHTSLDIKGKDVDLQGDVGGITRLNGLTINSLANIKTGGLLQVNENVVAKAAKSITAGKTIDAEKGYVELTAGSGDISTNGVSAGKTVSMAAGQDITLNGVVKAQAENDPQAIKIAAEGNFYNKTAPAVSPQPVRLLLRAASAGTQGPAIQVADSSAWKIYSNSPEDGELGNLDSESFAVWSWGKAGFQYNAAEDKENRYIFKYTPSLSYAADSLEVEEGTPVTSTNITEIYDSKLAGNYKNNFRDGDTEALVKEYKLDQIGTASDGFCAAGVKADGSPYDILLTNTENSGNALKARGYAPTFTKGQLKVTKAEQPEPKPQPAPGSRPDNGPQPEPEPETTPANPLEKPQIDALTTSNLTGTASINETQRPQVSGVDRVLGLQNAQLPFFNEKHGTVKFYGTYDVSVDPDKVKMEAVAKVLPEPDQPKTQYRELERELVTESGRGLFRLAYNGSTLDIYPADDAAKAMLVAGEDKKNEDIESQALYEAFNHMGISLDDLDGVYTHFESMKVRSFRR